MTDAIAVKITSEAAPEKLPVTHARAVMQAHLRCATRQPVPSWSARGVSAASHY
jgi:hypothetical protein